MAIELSEERREVVMGRLQAFFVEHFDQALSDFRAQRLMDFFVEALGPQIYNQAVQDARNFMLRKLDDLDGEVYEPEPT